MSLLLATLLVIDLPLGPGSEQVATQLVAPHEHAKAIDDGPWYLWDIRVQPRTLLYAVGKPHEVAAVTVTVDLDAAASKASDAVQLKAAADAPSEALAAAETLAATLRATLAGDTIRFTTRAPAPRDHPVDVQPSSVDDAPPRAPPAGTPRWLAALLLLFLATSLAVCRRQLAAAITRTSPRGWWFGAYLALVTGLLLTRMDDVVLHPNAHGWDTIRAVSGLASTPYPLWDRYGSFVLEVGRLLGYFAEPGRETFVAARVSAAGCVLLMYLLTSSVLRSHLGALIATGLLATSPALLFIGRGEALSATCLLFVLLSAWLLASAARRRDVWLLGCGAVALACLANFRLMGPIMAPVVGLFALLPPDEDAEAGERGRWYAMVAAALVLAALAASGHLWRMGWMMSAELGVRPQADVIPRSLVDSPMWTPFALVAMGGAGLLALGLRRPWVGALLTAWVACSVLAPASSSAFYQDQARYQTFAIPALALAAAAGLVQLAAWRRPIAIGATSLWLIWFGAGQSLAGEVLAVEQAEVVQLRAWRKLPEVLPKGAWLVVPVQTRGRARMSLPDVELLAARPDVRLVSLEEAEKAGDAPLYWFEGLACAARYPSDPPAAARDCVATHARCRLDAIDVTAVDPELAPNLARRVASPSGALSPFPGDPTQWNPRPFAAQPVRVGLYALEFEQ